jgi:hypothetical protein
MKEVRLNNSLAFRVRKDLPGFFTSAFSKNRGSVNPFMVNMDAILILSFIFVIIVSLLVLCKFTIAITRRMAFVRKPAYSRDATRARNGFTQTIEIAPARRELVSSY